MEDAEKGELEEDIYPALVVREGKKRPEAKTEPKQPLWKRLLGKIRKEGR